MFASVSAWYLDKDHQAFQSLAVVHRLENVNFITFLRIVIRWKHLCLMKLFKEVSKKESIEMQSSKKIHSFMQIAQL